MLLVGFNPFQVLTFAPVYGAPDGIASGWFKSSRVSSGHSHMIKRFVGSNIGRMPGDRQVELVMRRLAASPALEFERLRGPQIITVNALNEWAEGSYLELDNEYSMQYLEAIQSAAGLPPESAA